MDAANTPTAAENKAPDKMEGFAELPAPSADERYAIKKARENRAARRPAVKLGLRKKAGTDGVHEMVPTHNDKDGWLDRRQNAFGTRSGAFVEVEEQSRSHRPIVFPTAGNPVGSKLVGSLAEGQGKLRECGFSRQVSLRAAQPCPRT
jgi:hypothetical protein